MSETERSQLYEFSGGDVTLWAEAGEPIMLKSLDSVGQCPVELTSDEARDLAAKLLELAEWCDRT